MGGEHENADVQWGQCGVDDRLDCVEDVSGEGIDATGPGPVSGDEGAGHDLDALWEGEDRTAERELEADEVDGEERGLFGGFDEAGDGEADAGDGGVDHHEEDEVVQELAAELPEKFDKDPHPQ